VPFTKQYWDGQIKKDEGEVRDTQKGLVGKPEEEEFTWKT
jgi:hypothetical protein